MTSRVLPVAALLLASLPVASPAQLEAGFRAATEAADAVVLVEYVLEKEERGFGAVGQRAEMAAVGTIATADGLVVLSDNIFPEDETESRSPALPRAFLVRLRSGQRVPAELLGRDRDRSLAFLRIGSDAVRQGLAHVQFTAAAPLAVGDAVITCSLLPEKYGYAPSFTPTTVAAVLPGRPARHDLAEHLQDSSVGAPVFDARGQAIGVVTTDPFGQSLGGELVSPLELFGVLNRGKEPGFPVLLPASEFLDLLADPPRNVGPRAEKSWLGVTLQPVSRALAAYLELPDPAGVMVTSVWDGSPSDDAGLRTEDVIRRFDGQDVVVPNDEALPGFIERVQDAGVGREVSLEIWRSGRTRTVAVTLGAAPTTAVAAEEYRNEAFGLVAQDVTVDVILGRGWPPETRGALISEVERAGWAEVGGLETGDLILAVNGRTVSGPADLAAALEDAEAQRMPEVIFFVLRDPDTLFVPVKTSW